MAFICGLITKEEKETLERRGWEVEPGPTDLLPEPELCSRWSEDNDFWVHNWDPNINGSERIWCQVWVDSSMFEVMSGPDWDKSED